MISTALFPFPSATTHLSSINRSMQIHTYSELDLLHRKTAWRVTWKTIDGAINFVILA
jgi:hypothetical protein